MTAVDSKVYETLFQIKGKKVPEQNKQVDNVGKALVLYCQFLGYEPTNHEVREIDGVNGKSSPKKSSHNDDYGEEV